MGTVREYFDVASARQMAVHTDWTFTDANSTVVVNIVAKIVYDFDANAKYWYFFVPESPDLAGSIAALLRADCTLQGRLAPEGDGLHVESGFLDYSETATTDTLMFTRRVHLYVDAEISPLSRSELKEFARGQGLFLVIHDREYARKRTEVEIPLAFISHDFRDKEAFVRKLALELIGKQMCPVWYDEYSLKVGDSLRENIDRGLKETRKCILVLSPNFLSNTGWGKAEFDSIYMRELVAGHNVMLPVWHNVSKEQVYEYSPRLIDRLGISSALGAEEVARQLSRVIKATSA